MPCRTRLILHRRRRTRCRAGVGCTGAASPAGESAVKCGEQKPLSADCRARGSTVATLAGLLSFFLSTAATAALSGRRMWPPSCSTNKRCRRTMPLPGASIFSPISSMNLSESEPESGPTSAGITLITTLGSSGLESEHHCKCYAETSWAGSEDIGHPKRCDSASRHTTTSGCRVTMGEREPVVCMHSRATG